MLQPSIFQDFFVELHHEVRVVHLTCDRRGKHIRVIRVSAVLLNQQVHRHLGNRYLPDRRLRLRTGERYFPAGVADILFTDGDHFMRYIQIRPEEGHQLALSQTTDQFQAKHGQDVSGAGGIQVGLEMFRQKSLHLHLLHFGSDPVIGGVTRNPAFPLLLFRMRSAG